MKRKKAMERWFLLLVLVTVLGCDKKHKDSLAEKFPRSAGHITQETHLPSDALIPDIVKNDNILSDPTKQPEKALYTIVADEVPIKDLLFSIAQDANLNADININLKEKITFNVVDQTLEQILDRIAMQTVIRYQLQDGHLIVQEDNPYLKTHNVDYVNIDRTVKDNTFVSSQVDESSKDTNSNRSSTSIENSSSNLFWKKMEEKILIVISSALSNSPTKNSQKNKSNMVMSPETGSITVYATDKQHQQIAHIITTELEKAHRQVLIQATIVEVNLSNDHQAGIDWNLVNQNGGEGISVELNSLGNLPADNIGRLILRYNGSFFGSETHRVESTVRLLEEFGDVTVLSSPLMAVMNNQAAILKVVDNEVYFEIDTESSITSTGGTIRDSFDSRAKTLPVGIIMGLIPQINESGSVILHIKPTISRVIEYINDPNPIFRPTTTSPNPPQNRVPRIQEREFQSVLKLNDGDVAVLGGLMQDSNDNRDRGLPIIRRIPGIGRLFSTKTSEREKTELVIFIRPTIIKEPDVNRDLKKFLPLLPTKPDTAFSLQPE